MVVTAKHHAYTRVDQLREGSGSNLSLMRLDYEYPDVLERNQSLCLAVLANRQGIILYREQCGVLYADGPSGHVHPFRRGIIFFV